MSSNKLAIPVLILALFLGVILLVVAGGRKTKVEPATFANSVLNQNKKVFERLADM